MRDQRVIEAYLGAKYAGAQPGGRRIDAAPQKLTVASLQAGYGDVQVLWDISLEVAAGELVCIDRLERGRQDHADALPVRAAPSHRRRDRGRRPSR